jgi:hypothetical protein
MLILIATVIIAISACNSENPVTSDSKVVKPITAKTKVTNTKNSTIETIECGWTKRHTERGGPDGYEYVHYDANDHYTNIWCERPGHEICPQLPSVTTQSYPHGDMVTATNYAYNQISLGNLSGQVSNQTTGVVVKWFSNSSNIITATAEVKCWEISCSEPL